MFSLKLGDEKQSETAKTAVTTLKETQYHGALRVFFGKGSAQGDAATRAQGSVIQADVAGSSAVADVHTAMRAHTQPGTPPVEGNYS